MSQPSLGSANPPSVLRKKPQLNIYTVLLIISLVALLLAALFFFLELRAHQFDTGSQTAAVTVPASDISNTVRPDTAWA